MAIVIQVTKGKPSNREPIPLTGRLSLFVHDGNLEVAPPLGEYDGMTVWNYWNRLEGNLGQAARWLADDKQKLLEARRNAHQ